MEGVSGGRVEGRGERGGGDKRWSGEGLHLTANRATQKIDADLEPSHHRTTHPSHTQNRKPPPHLFMPLKP